MSILCFINIFILKRDKKNKKINQREKKECFQTKLASITPTVLYMHVGLCIDNSISRIGQHFLLGEIRFNLIELSSCLHLHLQILKSDINAGQIRQFCVFLSKIPLKFFF
jgi:hypothetical protein